MEANKLEAQFGWLPVSQAPTFADAVVCTDQLIIILRVTATSARDANLEGFEHMKDSLPRGFRTKRKWCLVFVTDDDQNAESLRMQEFGGLAEKHISAHSSVLDIRQLDLLVNLSRVEEIRVSRHHLILVGY